MFMSDFNKNLVSKVNMTPCGARKQEMPLPSIGSIVLILKK